MLMSSPTGRRRWLTRCAPVLLLAAVLPQLLYVGHWSWPLSEASHPEPAQQAEHRDHCHVDVSGCGDQPIPAGPGMFLLSEELLAPPVYERRQAALAAEGPPSETFIAPPEKPPRVSL